MKTQQFKAMVMENLTDNVQTSQLRFIAAFALCALLAFLLSKIYVRFASTHSNRKSFAANFILLSLTTMFIIAVVKSSLALSLGLVGALSIIRFRTAIKEPEELVYVFFAMAIGLGCGAGQEILTVLAFLGICLAVVINKWGKSLKTPAGLYLTITAPENEQAQKEVQKALRVHTSQSKIKRMDCAEGIRETTFAVEFEDEQDIQNLTEQLNQAVKEVKISFLDVDPGFCA